jgi:hypothetical protein
MILVGLIVFLVLFVFILSFILFLKYKKNKFKVDTKYNGKIIFKKSLDKFDIKNERFSLFQRGTDFKILNYYTGNDINNNLWEIIEFQYLVNSENYNFNIIKTNINNIPNLIINYKYCNHQIGNIFGYDELKYLNNSNKINDFSIQTTNEERTFKLFDNNEFTNFLNSQIKGNIEIENNNIVYYENNNSDYNNKNSNDNSDDKKNKDKKLIYYNLVLKLEEIKKLFEKNN